MALRPAITTYQETLTEAPPQTWHPGESTPLLERAHRVLAPFDTIDLAGLERVKLLNRVDTKYVMHADQLFHALSRLAGDYQVLDIDRRRVHHYQTLYFDTPDFASYRDHHDGQARRYKVRARAYIDSGLAFAEVKFKTPAGRTIKSRQRIPELSLSLTGDTVAFVQTYAPYDVPRLEPKLWNDFFRITLASQHRRERLTLDVGVSFQRGFARTELSGVAIAEVKQPKFSVDSDFVRQMRALGVRPRGFSKYCVGVAMLYPQIKYNCFKPNLLLVEQLMQSAPTGRDSSTTRESA